MTLTIAKTAPKKRVVMDKPRTPEFGPQKVQHPYYQYGTVLSHNAFYNFIVGGRGLGKTYGAKRLALNNYLKRGDMFVYLRRYKEELIARDTFFADIQHEFPQWDFRANGNTFEVAPASTRDDTKRQWDTMGYAIALSTAQKQKSVAFPRVKLIIFDEFIIEKGMIHYLPDEANVFNNFYSTVDRWQDKTRVLFLANSVSITNPYFIEYQITPSGNDELLKYNNGFIVCHFPNAADFKSSVLATKFGQFIKDTEYEKYAVGNQFADNHDNLLAPKNPRARAMMNLETRLGWLSIWHDIVSNEYYVAERKIINISMFTLLPDAMDKEKTLLMYNDDLIGRLRSAYKRGLVEFDSSRTRNMFLDVFHKKQ